MAIRQPGDIPDLPDPIEPIPRPRPVRTALFALAIVLLTLRGLRPIQPHALEWFVPLALGYGAIVDVAFTRWARGRTTMSSGEPSA